LRRGRKADTWKLEFKFPWREAGPPNHLDDKVHSDQYVVNEELSICRGVAGEKRGGGWGERGAGLHQKRGRSERRERETSRSVCRGTSLIRKRPPP